MYGRILIMCIPRWIKKAFKILFTQVRSIIQIFIREYIKFAVWNIVIRYKNQTT